MSNNNNKVKNIFDALEHGTMSDLRTYIGEVNIINSNEQSPLLFAILHNVAERKVKFLIEKGADIHFKDSNNKTLLMYAIENNKLVDIFIEKENNINALDNNNKNAFFYACVIGNEHILEALLIKDIEIQNQTESIFYLFQNSFFNNLNKRGLNILKTIFKKIPDEEINITDSNNNNLLMHLLFKRKEFKEIDNIILQLIDSKKIDFNIKNNKGISPLLYSIKNNFEKIALLLIQKGTNSNDTDNNGNSVLMFASYNNNLNLVSALFEKDADVNQRSAQNETALSLTLKNKFYEIPQYLLEKGAIPNEEDIHYVLSNYFKKDEDEDEE